MKPMPEAIVLVTIVSGIFLCNSFVKVKSSFIKRYYIYFSMKYSLILIALVLTLTTKGQTLNTVIQSLHNCSYIGFQSTKISGFSIDSYKKKGSNSLFSRRLIEREIVSNYREEVLTLYENIYADSNSSAHQVNEYRLQLLTKDTLIIFYNLTRKTSMYNEPIKYVVVDSFLNLPKLKDFADSFFTNYHTALKKEDLFKTKNVVGAGCGYSNTPTDLLVEAFKIKEVKDHMKLSEWLTSACVEKQLMAIWILYYFKDVFPKISLEQKRLIEIIKQKKGTANVCYGCSFTQSNIIDIIKRIEANQGI
jgi:hypothetical protein